VLDGRRQPGRRARAVYGVLQEHEVLRFGQLHPEGLAVVRRDRAADDTTPLLVRQHDENALRTRAGDLMAEIITRVWTSRGPTGKKVRHVS
jgi:hypothetical protein